MSSTETIDIDLPKYWLSLKRRWLPAIAVFGSMATLTGIVAFLQKPDYAAQGKLLLQGNRISSLTGVGQEIGAVHSLTVKTNPINTEIEVIRSIPLVQKAIDELNLKDDEGLPLKAESITRKRIGLKNIAATDVVEVSFKSNDPREAAAFVNKLMSLYIQRNLRTNRTEAVVARQFITEQLPKAEASVRQAEATLRQFKEKNQVAALEEEATSTMSIIKNLEEEVTQTQADLRDINTQALALQNQVRMTAEEAVAINSLNQSPGIQQLLEQFQEVQSQLAVESTRFRDNSPVITKLQEERNALENLLEERIAESLGEQRSIPQGMLQIGKTKQELIEQFANLELKRLGLVSRLNLLSTSLSNYQQRLNILPKLEQEQRELERILEAAQSTYQTLLKKLEEIRVAEHQNTENATIIEPALVPEKPSKRKLIIIIALGTLLNILLTTATVIILELRDTSIKTLKEAKELFGYTLLGTIPYVGKKSRRRRKESEWTTPEVPVRDTPRLPISEAYRMLQANLKFISSDQALKAIAITSSIPKEGKSTVAANLAAATAEMGRRVLLVDADMRHPMQHHIWELTNLGGLSDVLVNQAEFETIVSREVMPNLDVLTSGVMPPNPMALLDSKRMASLIEYFSEHYAFVIIDTPPLTQAADALTLGQMTDGILFVTRPGVVNSTSANAAKESLERSDQKVLGLVVNGLTLENEPDSYFYFDRGDSAEEMTTRESSPAISQVDRI